MLPSMLGGIIGSHKLRTRAPPWSQQRHFVIVGVNAETEGATPAGTLLRASIPDWQQPLGDNLRLSLPHFF